MRSLAPRRGARRHSRGTPAPARRRDAAPPVPREQKSRMAHALARGGFVVSVELVPPRGLRSRAARRAGARALKIRGVDSVNIPDGSARARAHERAVAGRCSSSSRPASRRSCTTPVATATCSACSRICSAPTRWGCATCCSSPAIPAESATIPTRRPCSTSTRSAYQRRVAAEHGLDVGGQAIGAPTGVPHRRVRSIPAALEPRRRAAALRLQGRGGRRVRRHAARLRRGRSSSAFMKRTRAAGMPIIGGVLCRSRALGTPSSWPTKCPACACPEAMLERMRRADADGRAADGRHGHRARDRGRVRAAGAGRADFDGVHGTIDMALGRHRWTSLTVQGAVHRQHGLAPCCALRDIVQRLNGLI